MGKQALRSTLKELLHDGMLARYEAGPHEDKVRRQAYADGFARAMCDAGLLSHRELLAIVAELRQDVAGAPLAATG